MNLHIMKDNKFYDGMTEEIISRGLINNNIYFVYKGSKGCLRYMKEYPNSIYGDSEDLYKINLSDYDKVIFHNLMDPSWRKYLSIQGRIKGSCKIYWRLWTGDNYRMMRYANLFQKPLTTKHNWGSIKHQQITNVISDPITVLRNIRARVRYRSDYEILKKALPFVDYAMNWNYFEYDLLKSLYPMLRAKTLIHGYVRKETAELLKSETEDHHELRICVGHSGYEISKHEHIFDIVHKKIGSKTDYRVYCPLSYGDKDYIDRILDYGRNIFGDRFIPMIEFMHYRDYIEILNSMDIFIYGQPIPMGIGNISLALRLGKKVFLSSGNPALQYLRDHGYTIYSIESIEEQPMLLRTPLDLKVADQNVHCWKTNRDHTIRMYDQTLSEIICK